MFQTSQPITLVFSFLYFVLYKKDIFSSVQFTEYKTSKLGSKTVGHLKKLIKWNMKNLEVSNTLNIQVQAKETVSSGSIWIH
jgi:hypothetical protein